MIITNCATEDTAVETFIIEIINDYGYLGIFLLITLENIFPPIPSEVILLFGGFLTVSTALGVPGVILVSTLGSVVGAIILYSIAYPLDEQRLTRIIERWGHILRLDKKDIRRADDWFQRFGVLTVFFCRLVPILRSLVSIPAGMCHMNFGKFLLFTVAGTAIWNTILVNIGAAVGASWKSIVGYFDMYSDLVLIALIILFVAFVVRHFWVRKS